MIDKQVHDEALHKLQSAAAAVAEAQARIRAVKAARDGSLAKRQMAEAQVKVIVAKADVAKADLQRVEALHQFSKIRAPFDGVLARQDIQTGSFVRAADNKAEPLFVVMRVDLVRVAVNMPETTIRSVKVGTPVVICVPALKGHEFQGKISRLAASLDLKTKTLLAEIDVQNTKGKLLPGMYAVVTIAEAKPRGEPKREEPQEGAKPEKLKALLQARLDAAKMAYDDRVRASKQIRREGNLLFLVARPQEVCTCSVNLLNAQRDLSPDKKDHVAALKSHLARLTDLEKRAKEMHEKGLIPPLEIRIVEFHRAQAELWLAQGAEQ